VLDPPTMRRLARALGSMGDWESLRKALPSATAGRASYSVEFACAALEGIAYLPASQNPLEKLRQYGANLADRELKAACEEAMIEASRLQAARGPKLEGAN